MCDPGCLGKWLDQVYPFAVSANGRNSSLSLNRRNVSGFNPHRGEFFSHDLVSPLAIGRLALRIGSKSRIPGEGPLANQ